ncbi:LicD family protein [Clostridium perfringens]|uniref:LicD family protein n=1 Tax=Clostridium perfringens TaxID=1502 RepID=UPI0001666261|nr:LicD family protein [Clostridium perfringens]AXH51542.1 hypothetical protein C8114_02640 [Clostridium perfringens]EDS80936.1 LicD family protein [Clostridium perfringens C str. JGS1495]MBI6030582.1 LicD family protein [Clostridium perfringens]MBI6033842.1 LicD family protein [Clostridium perfringens]NGT46718.1 LicD family protein [Clostridium perfringens]
MDEYKFKTEIHCYIEKKYDKFLEYRQYAIEILKEFHRICLEENITYYLSDGTLLGAIRDKDFIPWDYDVDVHVPYEEKDRLISALKNKLNKKYYIYCPEVCSKCRHFFLRVSKVGYNSSALHVDVFYVIGTPEDKYKYKKFSNKVKFVSNARYYKLVNAKEESFGKKAKYIYIIAYKILYGIIPLKLLNLVYKKLCLKYSYKDSKYYMTADVFGTKRYSRDLNRSRELIEIRNIDYFIPAGYKEILKGIYGDFKKYPSIESRYNEFMNSLNRLEYFDKITK